MVQFRRPSSASLPVYSPRNSSRHLSPYCSPVSVASPISTYCEASGKSRSKRPIVATITTNWKAWTLVALGILLLFGPSARCRAINAEVSEMRKKFEALAMLHERSVMSLSEASSHEKALQGDIDFLDMQNKEMARMIHEKSSRDGIGEEEKALFDKVERLQTTIQDISRMEAIERFGEGPHRVEFTLRFMNSENAFVEEPSNSNQNKFVIELAPLSLMPHSDLHFLHMIDHKLWDGAAFVHHVDHVIQAVPTAWETAQSMKDQFAEAGLTNLAFQEYHEAYPHDEYTVGFSGRPGGLEFYINTQDNTHLHGPGGQKQHDLHEEGDPCFAKVVSGHHVVDRMNQKNVRNPRDINIIAIERAVLL